MKEYKMKGRSVRRILIGAGTAAALLIGMSGCANQSPAEEEAGAKADSVVTSSEGIRESLYPMQTKSGQWGYVNLEGEMVLFPQYDEAGTFNTDGTAYVRIDNQAGYIDKKGEWVLGPKSMDDYFKFDTIKSVYVNQEAIAQAELQMMQPQPFKVCGKYGLVNVDGMVMIPFLYESLELIADADEILYIASCEDEKRGIQYGLLDEKGKILVDFEYEYISNKPVCGRILYLWNDSYGYLGMDGKTAIEAKYDNAMDFNSSSGYAVVQYYGLYGLIDPNGEIVVPMEYASYDYPDYMYRQEEGEAIYFFYDFDDKVKIYNAVQNVFLPGLYDNVDTWATSDNFIVVKQGEKYGAVNNAGEVVLDFKFKEVYKPDENGYVLASTPNGKWGMLDENGKTIVKFKYDDMWSYNELDYATVELNGKRGSVNREGDLIIPVEYDSVIWLTQEDLEPYFKNKNSETEKASDKTGIAIAENEKRICMYSLDGKLVLTLQNNMADESFQNDKEMEEAFCQAISENTGYEMKTPDELEALYDDYNENFRVGDGTEEAYAYYDYEKECYGLLDKDYNVLVEPAFNDIIGSKYEGIFITSIYNIRKGEEKSGAIYTENGKAYVIPAEYDSINVSENGVIEAQKRDTSVILNKYGNWMLQIYDMEALDRTKNGDGENLDETGSSNMEAFESITE